MPKPTPVINLETLPCWGTGGPSSLANMSLRPGNATTYNSRDQAEPPIPAVVMDGPHSVRCLGNTSSAKPCIHSGSQQPVALQSLLLGKRFCEKTNCPEQFLPASPARTSGWAPSSMHPSMRTKPSPKPCSTTSWTGTFPRSRKRKTNPLLC